MSANRQRWCCSCTRAEDKSEISEEGEEEEEAPTGGDISQERGERRQEEGRLQEEERRADFLSHLFIYDQPLREVGTLAVRRRGTSLLYDRCAAASAVNVDCSARQSVPAARPPPRRHSERSLLLPGTVSRDSTEEASLMAAVLGPTYITAGPLRVC